MSKLSNVSKWSPLAVLFETVAQFECADSLPHGELHARDRAIGKLIAGTKSGSNLYKKIALWLQELLKQTEPKCGARIRSAERGVSFLLGIIGLCCGVTAAGAVFMYDGSRPVNVLSVLLVYVALPLFFLCVTLCALLPTWLLRSLPGVEGMVDAAALFAPGRIYAKLVSFLPQRTRGEIGALLATAKRRHAVFNELEKFVTLSATQFFALGFFLGSLLYALGLVIFSDVAFAWSTTLAMGSGSFEKLVQILSTPWSGFIPDAVPGFGLIEDTRYFRWDRVANEPLNRVAIMKFGGWWPFLILCMAFYGVIPRLLLCYYTVRRMQRCARETLETYPGVADLLLRLESDPIATRAKEPEHLRQFEPVSEGGQLRSLENSGVKIGIDWSNSGATQAIERGALPAERAAGFVLHCGGAGSDIADDESILQAVKAHGAGMPVAFFVKAWEPPTEETFDFLKQLRGALGEHTPLYVVPLPPHSLPSHRGAVQPAVSEYLGVWQRRVHRFADPWTEIRTLPGDLV